MNGGGPPGFEWQVPGRPWQTITPTGAQGGPPGPPPPPGSAYTAPGIATGERQRGLWSEADRIAAQRQAAAQSYLARVQAGQRAAQAQQQLGLGGIQQQQMAAGVRGPLAQRAAMYGQGRAAGDLIAQQAMAAAQEEQAAQALLQETYGAGAQQRLSQAQQLLQGYGIAQQLAVERQRQAAAAAQAEQQFLQQAIGASVGAAGAGAAMSDRRLKQGVRRPRTAAEQELYQALMGGTENA